MTAEPGGGLWVTSERAGGGYSVALRVGDHHWRLDPRRAERYARSVLRTVGMATHDAAVLAQLVALGIDHQAAGLFIAQDLRANRVDPDDAATRPLAWRPIVSAADGRPLVQVWWGPDAGAQIEAVDATRHAVAVLEAGAAAEFDNAYYRALVTKLDMGPVRARAAVDDLGRFRVAAATSD